MANKTEAAPAGMGKADIKKHIMIARRAPDPIHIAFAIGADGKAILSMDKRKPPRAIEKALKEQAADSRNHRFGTLAFLPDQPKVARIVVNKPASGMARKLVVAMKGTGVRQIELVLEDGTQVESAQNEDDEDAGEADSTSMEADVEWQSDAEAPAHRPTIHIKPRHPEAETKTPDPAPELAAAAAETGDDGDSDDGDDAVDAADATDDTAAAGAPTQDAGALKATLTGMVKQMMAVIAKDPSQKAGLIELATDAQASLKRGDLDQAAAGMEVLRQALGSGASAMPQPTGAEPDASSPAAKPAAIQPAATPAADGKKATQRYRKSREVWMATRAKVDADIQKLSKKILSMDHGDAFGDDLEQNFTKAVDPVLSTLDDSLATILSDAEKAPDKAELDRLLEQARTTIGLYQQFVASNTTIQQLDANPFMPVAIGKTLGASLGVLAASMH